LRETKTKKQKQTKKTSRYFLQPYIWAFCFYLD